MPATCNNIERCNVMPKPISLVGRRFTRLLVRCLDPAPHDNPKRYWICDCDCGNVVSTQGRQLVIGDTKSCGCLRLELNRNPPHGHARAGNLSPTYRSWRAMLSRCRNKNHPAFHRYGGAGVIVCEHWRNSFAAFLEDMGIRPSGTSIHRKENAKVYCKENCEWATPGEQSRCQHSNRPITAFGVTALLCEWSEITRIDSVTIGARLKRGWPIEKALTVRPELYHA